MVNLDASDFFSTFLHKSPYSVTRYPRVAFDYRFEKPGCNLNLVSVVNGDMQIIGFAGRNGGYEVFVQNTIGQVPDVRQDNQWHRTEVNLGALLRKRYPKTPRFNADYLGTWATGATTAYDDPQGVSLWLDNVTLYSTQSTSAAFEWQPPQDDNGIQGYSYTLDHNKDTVPGEKIVTASTRCQFSQLKSGLWYFHLLAVDNAGNWSPASHIRFELTAPASPQ